MPTAHTILIGAIILGATLIAAVALMVIRRLPNCSGASADMKFSTTLVVGVAISVTIGAAMHNIALGIAVGVTIGIGLGSAQQARRRDE
jgi:hypothetical protein